MYYISVYDTNICVCTYISYIYYIYTYINYKYMYVCIYIYVYTCIYIWLLLIVYVCFICIFIHTNSYFTRTFSQFSTSMSTVRRVPYMNHQPKLLPSRQGQRPSTEHQRPRTLGYFEAVSLSHKEWNMPLGTHTHNLVWYGYGAVGPNLDGSDRRRDPGSLLLEMCRRYPMATQHGNEQTPCSVEQEIMVGISVVSHDHFLQVP